MTFKERKEFDSLSADIASLEEEKKQIEADLSGASLSVDEITERSRRMQEIIDALDEKRCAGSNFQKKSNNKQWSTIKIQAINRLPKTQHSPFWCAPGFPTL